MNPTFWLERWANKEIGFHQAGINGYLQKYWPQLDIPTTATAFVPLCGKSLDMRWLRERGHPVLGIEVARVAVSEFFQEWNVPVTPRSQGAFERWEGNGVTLLCGDFFDLQSQDVASVGAVFDRAALIALPPPLRVSYANKMREILPPSTPILLVTADYPQEQMSGPPFAVNDREMRELFAGSRIEQLAEVDVTDSPDNARFRQRGLSQLIERVYRVQ